MEAAIQADHVTFRYLEGGQAILEDVSLTIPAGKITVLMGSSGCGKSTLASVLCGLFPENGGSLDSGEITLFGDRLTDLSLQQRARTITMMFQNPDLQFCMKTLREELYFCLENLQVKPELMEKMSVKAVRLMETEDLLDRELFSLSGGEKQRAMLTCLHLLDARCIILDEAFANLDPSGVRDLLGLLEKMCQEGKTILAIDHMCDHWLEVAHRFVILGKGGKVLEEIEDPKKLPDYQELFAREGIAYPGIWQEKRSEQGEPEAALSLDNFSLKNGQDLLFQGSLDFPKGKISAILGRSGCGKTSFLMTILKQRAYEGSLFFCLDSEKKEVRKMKEKECFSFVSMAFQNPSNQFVTQNVLAEVEDGMEGISPEEDKKRALELLDSCQLRPYQNYSPYMLSQGQQRRLAVLSVLSAGQRLLLLDEPTYGQDYKSARALMDLIVEKVEKKGLTVLMTTHDRGLARAYGDKLYLVEDKTIREVADL
ncbi:MAG: ATP-binding cassette domain-containing protein [Eubacterium sp.]|nr:ATP-binding cassette domain-containing protein [Eubacterium sp.]